jgi:Bifunctional DNA primase/polymerase, N-terminal
MSANWAHFLIVQHGLRVFPLAGVLPDGACTCYRGNECSRPGKHPAERGWQHKSTNNPVTVERLFPGFLTRNLGVATGGGLVVLDADTPTALEPLETLPETLTTRTPRGTHLYFHAEGDFRNAVGVLPGLDVRAHGGLVVAPPSTVKGGRYEFVDPMTPIARMPAKISMLLTGRRERHRVALSLPEDCDNEQEWAIAAFDRTLQRVASAPEGHRNTKLYKHACTTIELIALGHLKRCRIDDLSRAAEHSGLTHDEAERTVRSALDHLINPRDVST